MQTTGTQYLQIPNITVSDSDVCSFNFLVTDRSQTYCPVLVFGQELVTHDTSTGNFGYNKSQGKYSGWFDWQEKFFGPQNPSTSNIITLEFSFVSGTLSASEIIGNNTYTNTWSVPSFNSGVYLCWNRTYSGTVQSGRAKMYYLLLSNNMQKKLELIPCYRQSDSVAGMYDRVAKAFYTNNGTGSFTVGGDISA